MKFVQTDKVEFFAFTSLVYFMIKMIFYKVINFLKCQLLCIEIELRQSLIKAYWVSSAKWEIVVNYNLIQCCWLKSTVTNFPGVNNSIYDIYKQEHTVHRKQAKIHREKEIKRQKDGHTDKYKLCNKTQRE